MSKVTQCPDPVTNGVACSIITTRGEEQCRVETAQYQRAAATDYGYLTLTQSADGTGLIYSETIADAQKEHAHTVTAICSMFDKNL